MFTTQLSKWLAQGVAIVLHPLCISMYVLYILVQSNPYLFGFNSDKAEGLLYISVFTITVMFPTIAILLMKGLGLIKSIHMHEKEERIGPLICTGIFYMWLYINFDHNSSIPTPLTAFILGSTIAIFMALLINSFQKISLHTIGAGGLVAASIFLTLHALYEVNLVQVPIFGFQLILSDRYIVMFSICVAGLIGWSRLRLQAHTTVEVYGGYIIGILAQMIAFRVIL